MTTLSTIAQTKPMAPDAVYGQLFEAVQMSRIFPDNKTFVDCTPKQRPDSILADYKALSSNPAVRFSLRAFVEGRFNMPEQPPAFDNLTKYEDAAAHIAQLWPFLQRQAAPNDFPAGEAWRQGSLLPLPYPYIVPGGRFREIYYWDSYFTMLGLRESKQTSVIENMVNNFAYLINTYGHIPNGNRSYYLSRSQPPFFSLMVQLLAAEKGDAVYKTYLPALDKEYAYWMDKTAPTKHVVKMPDGSVLNRYYDRDDIPRQESYYEDVTLANGIASPAAKAALYRNLRSGAESGWDFSSRWFADPRNMATIQITDIVPVDLNSLLYNLELVIAKAKKLKGAAKDASLFAQRAEKRRQAIEKYCWNAKIGFYFDYNLRSKKQHTAITAAGVFPLCFINLYPESMQAKGKAVANVLRQHLLKDGGIVTTTQQTGQQWDAPNGWAPLQWMTVWALSRCEQYQLMTDIVERWTKLNEKVYANTGKFMEKYNVVDTHLEAGGGEYPSQDGFGWTNGVYLAMKAILK
jgi:alpha,alpha-trehalase